MQSVLVLSSARVCWEVLGFCEEWEGQEGINSFLWNGMDISDTVWILWPLCCLHCGGKETAERHQCFNCLQLVKLGLYSKGPGSLWRHNDLAERLLSLGTVSPEENWGHLRGRKSFWQALQKDLSCLSVAWLPVSHYQKPICTSQPFVTGGFL